MAIKITKDKLKQIILEEFNIMLEQGQVPANVPDALKGPTHVGQAIPQKSNPIGGPTYVAPAAAPSAGMQAIQQGGTYVAPASPQQTGAAPTVPANTLVNIKKQLAVLTSEIDKVLGGLANAAGGAKPKKK